MIPIEFSMAVALWVGMATLGILSFWFLSTRRQTVSFPRSRQQEIWQCPVCIYLYDDEINRKLSICPRCGSYNRKEENGKWRIENGKKGKGNFVYCCISDF